MSTTHNVKHHLTRSHKNFCYFPFKYSKFHCTILPAHYPADIIPGDFQGRAGQFEKGNKGTIFSLQIEETVLN